MTTLNEYYQFKVFYLLKLWNNYRNIGSFIGNKESKKKKYKHKYHTMPLL